jgi:spermidine synthase
MPPASPLKRLKRWIQRLPSVEVSEMDGVRSLHLGGDAIQSSIRIADPERLELSYTRAMMAFLLFQAAPRDVLMVGLGGGSIARFLHHHFERTRITAVEINPKVITVARQYFGLPEDDERLTVVTTDGAAFVPDHPASADVLFHDAFDDGDTVSALCTQDFFDACGRALRPNGVFVMNFMADEPHFDTYFERIAKTFNNRALAMPTGDRVNRIVFAIKSSITRMSIESLTREAASLEKRYGLPMKSSLKDLLRYNPHTAAYLTIAA